LVAALALGCKNDELIDRTVARDTPVPIVRVTARVPLPDRYLFAASLTLPMAECSWVVSVQAAEPDMTGTREAIALDSFLREQGPTGEQDKPSADESLQEWMARFDPYQSRWDGLVDDPLTTVRKHITQVEQSLALRPEVLGQAPFEG
jgi:hypothetical protein